MSEEYYLKITKSLPVGYNDIHPGSFFICKQSLCCKPTWSRYIKIEADGDVTSIRTIDEKDKPSGCYMAFVEYVEAPLCKESVVLSKSDLVQVISTTDNYNTPVQDTVSQNLERFEAFYEQWKTYRQRIYVAIAVLFAEILVVVSARVVEMLRDSLPR